MALTIADRLDIHDLIARYGWALDTGDADGVVAAFTPDGVVEVMETTFEAYFPNIREWITNFLATNEGFRGRQHYITQIVIDGDGDAAQVKAFWMVVKAETVTSKTRFIHNNGYYDNSLVKIDGRWLFKKLRIRSWNDQDLPWRGPVIGPGVKEFRAMTERRAAKARKGS